MMKAAATDLTAMRNAVLLLCFGVAMTLSQEKTPPNEQCPGKCTCGVLTADRNATTMAMTVSSSRWSVDCSNLNLTSIPAVDRTNAVAEAFLASDNRITHVDLAFLRRFPNLKVFNARNGSIRSLTKSTKDYQPLTGLTHMDLSANHLHVIHPYVFTGFPSLRKAL